MKTILGLGILILLPSFLGYLALTEKQVGFIQRIHKDDGRREWKYALFVPQQYKGDQPCPLILYLHGFGSRGVDGSKQTADGLGPFIKDREKMFEILALFPQSETGRWDADSPDAQRAMAILEEVMKEYAVDVTRIYLMGTSMGGFGVWSLAARYPERWAAIVPICGGGDPHTAGTIKHIPCWCFHGAKDNIVDVGQSRRMIAALQAAGASPRYTEYAGVGHSCWDSIYATPELLEWLARQCLP